MLQYENFEKTVLAECGAAAANWRHVLPAVPLAYRLRFVDTIRKGFTVPEAYDIIVLSQTLNDTAFEEFVLQARAKKLGSNMGISSHMAAPAGGHDTGSYSTT